MIRMLFMLGRLAGVAAKRDRLDMAAPAFGHRSLPMTLPTIIMGAGLVAGMVGLFLLNPGILLIAGTVFGIGLLVAVIQAILD